MAFVDGCSAETLRIDDSHPLTCSFENYRVLDNHTEYIIKVHRGLGSSGKTWTIFRRYKEFEKLDKELQAAKYNIRLPPKKYIGNMNGQFILQRQEKLQKYMNDILNDLILSSTLILKKFLDPNNKYYNNNFQDTAFQHASMVMRGKPKFHNLKALSGIGWRFNKQFCKVQKYNETKREYITTWISEYGINMLKNEKELYAAFKVISDLNHPYIMPIVCNNFSLNGALLVRPECTDGSLRELIYEHSKSEDFVSKCMYRRQRIVMPVNYAITISVQVLHALKFLHDKNIPYGNLHTGNIFIEEGVAKISEIENSIFGLWTIYKPYILRNRRIRSISDLDVYCFGHVLYEMIFGERVDSMYCDEEILLECHDNLRPILQLILSNINEKLPTVSELLSIEVFNMCSENVVYAEKPRCKISAATKEALKKCKLLLETKLHNEQVELRRFEKMKEMQKRVDQDEVKELLMKKTKYRLKKLERETSFTSSTNDNEDMSISSTPSNSEMISSSVNNDTDAEFNSTAVTEVTSATTSDGQNSRNELLQSIVGFNKQKLKRIQHS